MKSLGVLFLLAVFIGVRCEVDFKGLSKMAQLLEKNGKLTPETIQPYSPSEINAKVKEAVLAFVEYCKKRMLVNGTLYIPFYNILKEMKEAQSFVKGSFRDVQIKNLDSLRFHNLTTDIMNLTSSYAVLFEKDLVLTGLYQMQGEFIGQKLYGEGVFDILIRGMKCGGVTGAVIQNKHFRIISMDSNFDMDDIKINITNFTLENFTQEEVSNLINSAAIIYVKQYQDLMSKLGAPVVIEYVNSLIRDQTVTDLYNYVQKALGGPA